MSLLAYTILVLCIGTELKLSTEFTIMCANNFRVNESSDINLLDILERSFTLNIKIYK